jgi:hypothetical protein
MRKILLFTFALCLLSIAATAQVLTDSQYITIPENQFVFYTPKTDTVHCVLHITNSKLNKLQAVPGYAIITNGRIKGFLSRQRKPLPKKVEVWYHSL